LNLAHDVGDDPGAVSENMVLFQRATGVQGPLLRVVQVHGRYVVPGDQLLEGGSPSWTESPRREADGIVGGTSGQVLAVQVADCAAVLIADPRTRAVAAIHAGWRGVAAGVIRQGVRALGSLGCQGGDLVVAVGPRICSSCYEVGAEVARRFPESVEDAPGRADKYLLDLGRAIEVSLIAAGISSDRIEVLGHCTFCEEERFFSHRRSPGGCGRNLGFIARDR
jgi:YfiH family protein